MAAWKNSPVMQGRQILFSKQFKLSNVLPTGTTNAAAIIFAYIQSSEVFVTRVDVKTKSPGGMSGEIFDVKNVSK